MIRAAEDRCSYQTSGWHCESGVLVISGGHGSLGMPCPACRTQDYLDRAWHFEQARSGAAFTCTCCPLRQSAVWNAALNAARAANPAETRRALQAMKRRRNLVAEEVF